VLNYSVEAHHEQKRRKMEFIRRGVKRDL